MGDALATYLHDHLSGADFAIDLLQDLSSRHAGHPLGEFAKDLLFDVEEDRQVLQGLVERVGNTGLDIKEAAAWLGEKVSRLKLRSGAEDLGTFQALEFLALGIWGKRALWRALEMILGNRSELQVVDYGQLTQRAESQHNRVEEKRLQIARSAFAVIS